MNGEVSLLYLNSFKSVFDYLRDAVVQRLEGRMTPVLSLFPWPSLNGDKKLGTSFFFWCSWRKFV